MKCGSTYTISATLGTFNLIFEISRFHRSMTRPFFTRERISDFDIYDKNCSSALKLARTRLEEGYPFDFQVHISARQCLPYFHGSVWHLGLGCPVHFGLCFRVFIWAWCWISVSEHSLSNISGTSEYTFILQPSFDNIYQSILTRTNFNYCTPIAW